MAFDQIAPSLTPFHATSLLQGLLENHFVSGHSFVASLEEALASRCAEELGRRADIIIFRPSDVDTFLALWRYRWCLANLRPHGHSSPAAQCPACLAVRPWKKDLPHDVSSTVKWKCRRCAHTESWPAPPDFVVIGSSWLKSSVQNIELPHD
jgi:hypothetical protein